MSEVTPKISVIVPMYNVEKYLRLCIISILNQTFEDFELILRKKFWHIGRRTLREIIFCRSYALKILKYFYNDIVSVANALDKFRK